MTVSYAIQPINYAFKKIGTKIRKIQAQTIKSMKQSTCLLCQRNCPLTFHHLIPRKLHRRTHFRKHYSKDQLNAGINICRQCHSGIHKQYDEMQLGKQFPTLQALQADEILHRHFQWVSRQKVNHT